MTPIVVSPEEMNRRFAVLRAAVIERKKARIADPHAFNGTEPREHPIVAMLWDSLVWLHDYWMILTGYVEQISVRGRANEVVTCLETSAAQNRVQTVTERLLELHHALTCANPAQIHDATLRRVVSIARLQHAAPLITPAVADSHPTAGGDPT